MVLGEPSFGKGLVQNLFPLGQGTGLALTIALYYTPSGRSIQKPLNAEKFELGGATADSDASQVHPALLRGRDAASSRRPRESQRPSRVAQDQLGLEFPRSRFVVPFFPAE